MPATVIAERVEWSGSITWFRESTLKGASYRLRGRGIDSLPSIRTRSGRPKKRQAGGLVFERRRRKVRASFDALARGAEPGIAMSCSLPGTSPVGVDFYVCGGHGVGMPGPDGALSNVTVAREAAAPEILGTPSKVAERTPVENVMGRRQRRRQRKACLPVGRADQLR
jgi:hypothetical protein